LCNQSDAWRVAVEQCSRKLAHAQFKAATHESSRGTLSPQTDAGTAAVFSTGSAIELTRGHFESFGRLFVSHTTFLDQVPESEFGCLGNLPGKHSGPNTSGPHSAAVAGRVTFQLE
jgi:hypothetical protein